MNVEELFAAIQAGDVEAVREGVGAHPELAGARDAGGLSAVVFSLYHGQPEVREVLLEARPELDVFDLAALGEHKLLKKLLKQHRELASERSSDGFTALHLACFFGRRKAADVLLDFGADPRAVSDNPMKVQPIHSAAAVQQTAIVERLLAEGADVDAAQVAGWTPLHAAAHSGALDMARLLVAHGAKLGKQAEDGRTPLDLAREAEQLEILHFLQS